MTFHFYDVVPNVNPYEGPSMTLKMEFVSERITANSDQKCKMGLKRHKNSIYSDLYKTDMNIFSFLNSGYHPTYPNARIPL